MKPDNPLIRTFIFGILHASPSLPAPSLTVSMTEQDWDGLLRISRMHRLGPVLHDGIKRKDMAGAVPDAVKSSLLAAQRKHTLRNLTVYQTLLTLTRTLEAAGIKSIALKGAYLASFAYPELGLRPMRDLDLLLTKETVLPAFALLKAQGYRPTNEGSPEAYLEGNKLHLPTLISPQGIAVELHHRLTFPHPAGHTDAFEQALWSRSIARPISQNAITFLCVEDLLIHLCYHATIGHQFSLGPLALLDIALLVQSHRIDWEDVLRIANQGMRNCVLAPLFLARKHLDADVPEWVLTQLEGEDKNAEWQESAEYLLFSELSDHMLLNANMQQVLCSTSWRERTAALANTLFPPRKTLATHFPVRADSPAAFLYYPKNWQRLLKRKIPSLMSSLIRQPREVEKLAGHKRAINQWLASSPPYAAAKTE